MRIIEFKVHCAFEDADCIRQAGDHVADMVIDFVLDNLGAEVAYTSGRSDRDVDYPDFSANDEVVEDHVIEDWHERARKEMT